VQPDEGRVKLGPYARHPHIHLLPVHLQLLMATFPHDQPLLPLVLPRGGLQWCNVLGMAGKTLRVLLGLHVEVGKPMHFATYMLYRLETFR